jgi:hypothetical protein
VITPPSNTARTVSSAGETPPWPWSRLVIGAPFDRYSRESGNLAALQA